MPHLVNDFASKGTAVAGGSDTVFTKPVAILVCATGNVKFDTLDGDTLTVPINGVPFLLPWAVKKVYSTSNGTTVTNGNLFSCQLYE